MAGFASSLPAGYAGPFGFQLDFQRQATSGQQPSGGGSSMPTYSGGTGGGSYGYGPASGQYTEEDRVSTNNQFNRMNAQFEHERDMFNRQVSAQQAQARMAADQRAQALSGLQNMFASASGSFGSAPAQMPQFTPIQAPQLPAQARIGAPDMAAAQAAQFARAKDQAGEVARSALAGLRSQLGGRNLLGSGAELRGMANVANRGVAQLGELSRDQAIQGSEANQQAALANFQGQITQRGQDIGAQQWVNQFNAQQQQAAQEFAMRQQEQQQQQQFKLMDMILNSIARY
jgi:hypothetical protein